MSPLSYQGETGGLGYFYLLSTRTRAGSSGAGCALLPLTHARPVDPGLVLAVGSEAWGRQESLRVRTFSPLWEVRKSKGTTGGGSEAAGALSGPAKGQ